MFKTTTIILLMLIFSFSLNAQEKKEDHKGEIKKFEDQVSQHQSDSTTNENAAPESENEGSSFFWDPAFLYHIFIYSPFFDSLAYQGKFWSCHFADYPYVKNGVGLFSMDNGKGFSLILNAHYFRQNSRLYGLDFRGRYSPWNFLGVEFHLIDFAEKNEDHLQIYDILLNYYRVRAEHWTLYWGVGMKGMEGSVSYKGVAFNIGSEIFPFKPLSFSFNVNAGSLNNTTVSELLLQLNYHLQRSIFYIGYQRFTAGLANLHGIIGGIGIYL